jgi:hypothetical protein
MQFDWFEMSEEDANAYRELCPPNQFRVLPPAKLPGPLPDELTRKYDSVVLLASGTSSGSVYYMLNGHRVDQRPKEIDQMPFGFVHTSGQAPSSGCLIQHGNWPERTTTAPPDFWTHVDASGLGSCFPISELPTQPSGTTSELKVQSQLDAFNALVAKLNQNVSGLAHVIRDGA